MVFVDFDGGVAPVGVGERFFTAWTSTQDPVTATIELLPSRLCRAMALVLGVEGASISLLDNDVRVPLGASDDTAAAAEKLQFTCGEGPCLVALSASATVVATSAQIAARWPAFAAELTAASPYRSVVSLPLRVASHAGGAIDLYLTDPTRAQDISIPDAVRVAQQISAALTLGAQASPPTPLRPGPGWLYGPTPKDRMTVWVALGMIRSRHHLGTNSALALLRGYAYAHGQLIDDVAAELVHQKLPLDNLTP
jgi:hypothetical protein